MPDLYPHCFGDDPASVAAHYDHGAGGLQLFCAQPDLFCLPGETDAGIWMPLFSAIMGHHGEPPDIDANDNRSALRRTFGRAGIAAACAFIRRVHELLDLPARLPSLERRRMKHASFAVAGLAVLADWIGSSQAWFPYRSPSPDLANYLRGAQERAALAVEQAGVVPSAQQQPSHL